MGYNAECCVCGTSGTVPQQRERVAHGTRLYRTLTDEWAAGKVRSEMAPTEAARQRAQKRAEHAAKWEHYCPDHAVEEGIAPALAAHDVVYQCVGCGHTDDAHGTTPVDGGKPKCRECGSTALRRQREEPGEHAEPDRTGGTT